MKIKGPEKSVVAFLYVLLVLCCGWLQHSAWADGVDSSYIIDANGHDDTQRSFVLQKDLFGNDDKWDETSAPPVSITRVIAVAQATLSAITSAGAGFEPGEVKLKRFNNSPFWYYLVTFQKGLSLDIRIVPVLFSGKPVAPTATAQP